MNAIVFVPIVNFPNIQTPSFTTQNRQKQKQYTYGLGLGYLQGATTLSVLFQAM